MFKDKTLLITGGTGSFGNAVLDRFLKRSENIKKYIAKNVSNRKNLEEYKTLFNK